jgi:hypothetical protein
MFFNVAALISINSSTEENTEGFINVPFKLVYSVKNKEV